MTRHLVLRLAETFFRRWVLYLLPIVVLGLAGLAAESMGDVARRAAPLDGPVRNLRRGLQVEIFHVHPVECTVFRNF